METKALLKSFISTVISAFGVSMDDIRSKCRKAELCDIRMILIYEMRQGGYTYARIGEVLHRDYSTIMWNFNNYEARFLYDENFKKKVLVVKKLKDNEMNILLNLDNSKLLVLNNSMLALDTINLQSQPRQLKSSISICTELRTELLQRAIKRRQKDKAFTLKMSYYKADALWQFLTEYEIYFPDDFGSYEKNAVLIMKNELHKQLL
ncbi:helix-turn-helix domain-containing protein [Chryseobacterium herbae]|uniref:Chromosomal replication initiator DnaA C-terminal domain-containing protein n=1 Tax=Chryseobacterium herbae TaxID=2976476 RepID=A0ABT2IYR5_9FLAO|nr:helix-turn-helix domain-containing protein [Chryseobacterium sp. pc1-10]MCT2563970.1 hypothetical protein [Chryseobacterium sp. pc1-10]